MTSFTRREFVKTAGITAAVTLSGCSGKNGESADTESPVATEQTTETDPPANETPGLPFEVPSSGECTVSDRPEPTPTDAFQPKEYPEYPEDRTVASREAFASAYEGAFQHNRYLTTEADSSTRNLQVDVEVQGQLTEDAKNGLLIGVSGELNVMQGGAVEDNPVVGVYYLASDVALRGDISRPTLYEVDDLRSVAVEETQTVYCASSS